MRQEYELTYYDSVVQHFNQYATRTPPLPCTEINKKYKRETND